MKNIIGKKITLVLLLAVLFGGVSCKKMLTIEPEDQVDISKAYLTLADADAAVLGIYGKFVKLSKQYVILNELRADLVDVTGNADPYLREISEHNVTSKNPYANPRQYYELILNCNDALKGLKGMVAGSRLSVEEFNRRYSDIGALRSWLYLQLGIHYGNVPYITEPFESIDDLNNLSRYPKITFDVLLDSLLDFTAKLPYAKTVSEVFAYPAGNSLNIAIDGNVTERFYITKPILLGDLYLWKGQYLNAATQYKLAMEQDQGVGGNNWTETFRLSTSVSNEFHSSVQFQVISGTDRPQDESALVTLTTQGWRSLFGESNSSRSWQREWYWSLPFSSTFKTTNPFVELFASNNDFLNGKYLLKPSQAIIDNWNSQVTVGGLNFDPRGRLSMINFGGNPVITKFTDHFSSIVGGGQWNIWRAAGVHLHYAEAANRDGQGKIGWALLNTGILSTYSPGAADPPTLAQLNLMITPYPTTSPYYFDARNAGANNTGIRMAWMRNRGVRGRAKVAPYSIASQTDQLLLEDQLINEASLELAFEGQRWADLLRIALRRNNSDFIADKIAAKFAKKGEASKGDEVKSRIKANYYLPFDIYN